MLWVWLKKSFMDALMSIGYLLIPPPPTFKPPVPHRVISPNTDCPACGNVSGKIECVPMPGEEGIVSLVIRHTCNVCSGSWHEPTVVKDTPGLLYPSINSIS